MVLPTLECDVSGIFITVHEAFLSNHIEKCKGNNLKGDFMQSQFSL